ncbi:MAG: hypothetical protein OYH77_00920 [Pseudomonadota bacterium]|nr:hypothetical protein [Pseudomonadota bacterium]
MGKINKFLVVVLILHGTLLFAEEQNNFIQKDESSSVQEQLRAKIRFGTSMVGFQDMSTPLLYSRAFQARLRSDGLVPADAMDDLYGVAATFALGLAYPFDRYELGYRLSYSSVAGMLNQTVNGAASLSSLNSDLTATYMLTPKFRIGVGVVGKHNSFSNIAQGHSLLSLSPLAELSVVATSDTTLRGYVDYALAARLGKARSSELFGSAFPNSRVRSGGFGIEVEHRLTELAMLAIGFEQSITHLKIPDVGIDSPIPLAERIPSPRILSLRTQALSIGLVRTFGH